MLLSEAYEKHKSGQTYYAACSVCQTAWIDDMPHIGSLMCPKCPDTGLVRGVTSPADHGCVLDTSDQPEYFKVRCAGCDTPYNRIGSGTDEACPACGVYAFRREEVSEDNVAIGDLGR
jgi:predicted RNA-binding Zn-ribbon protein involved in translation (DUF1610 family)